MPVAWKIGFIILPKEVVTVPEKSVSTPLVMKKLERVWEPLVQYKYASHSRRKKKDITRVVSIKLGDNIV